jgi:4-amino-4-deoxy-L-arabinose transferase-like glycosyltransferase
MRWTGFHGHQILLHPRWRLAALLLATVLLLRTVGLVFGVVDNDETDFLLVGKVLSTGGLPYVDAFDHKPPLLYLLFLPSAWLTWRLWPMQLVAVVFVTATCLALERAATRWTGVRAAGVAAALGCALATACNVVSVNAELLLNLPASVALWCFVIAEEKPRLLFACGLAIGLASLIKHQAGILLAAVALAELLPPRRGAWGVLLLMLGFALLWLVAIGLYAAHGQLAAFYEWNLTRNLHYLSHSFGSPLVRFFLGTVAYGFGAAPLLWRFACRRSRGILGAPRTRAGLVLALWLTWIPVSLGGRFYNHYYLQFVPPLCLLAAAPAAALWRMRRRLPRLQRRSALALVLLPVVTALSVHVGRGLAGQYPSQDPRTRAIADWLRAHTRPDERVVVYGHFTPVYQEAERLPGTRYIHTSQLFGNVDAMQLPTDVDATRLRAPADEAAFIDDLATRRAQWLVDTSPADIKSWSKLPLAALPSLARYVSAHYRKVASPGGAAVYSRLSP